jgi:orotidine-5'-phosphate decarboxylase
MRSIVRVDRSIIPACDVGVERFEQIIRETHSIKQVGAYKISAALALSAGLPQVVKIARKYTDKPLIYDHQKAATDIPDTGKEFISVLKSCGIDALILFPLAGPATQRAWTKSAQEVDLPVIVGGYMTHEAFLESKGGYIHDDAVNQIFKLAAETDVSDFVVPGNKPGAIRQIRELVSKSVQRPIFYAPGFIAQGGLISEAAKEAGASWHAIIGRAIYDAPDIAKATRDLATAI